METLLERDCIFYITFISNHKFGYLEVKVALAANQAFIDPPIVINKLINPKLKLNP